MWVDEMITQLRGVYYNYEIKKDGTLGAKKGKYVIPTKVCPIQLWDIAFPKEYQDQMLATLFCEGGKPMNPKHAKFIWAMQKAMGLKKIPDYDPKRYFPMKSAVRQHIEMIGIGIKEDRMEDGTEML